MSGKPRYTNFKRISIILAGVLLAFGLSYVWFGLVPEFFEDLNTFKLVVILLAGVLGLSLSARVARRVISPYNTAEVEVSGPITRSSGGLMSAGGATESEKVVEQIEKADENSSIEALKIHLNTPGGEVVPSDDIRKAVDDFDGVTVAYASDVCASGGYWIATACDKIYAREPSLVGSIGVLGSNVNAKELADKAGLSYERIVAGSYKDAGNPLREMEERDREYLQGIVDGFYDIFVERVSAERNMSERDVKDTEAKIYLGKKARDIGLVDELGDEKQVEEYIEGEIGAEPHVKEYEPQMSFAEKLQRGTGKAAYMCGKGMASVFDDDDFDFRM